MASGWRMIEAAIATAHQNSVGGRRRSPAYARPAKAPATAPAQTTSGAAIRARCVASSETLPGWPTTGTTVSAGMLGAKLYVNEVTESLSAAYRATTAITGTAIRVARSLAG